jgi:hypothetical protein
MLTRRFSLIELALVMLVVAIAAHAVFSRTLRYFEAAEKAAMTITVLEVERGMRVRLALSAMGRTAAPAVKVEDANPFEFAHAVPPNYLGELDENADLSGLTRGNWFYDRARREIAYVPRLSSRLKSPDGAEVTVLRFRVERWGGPRGLPHLASVSAYRWEPEFGTF